MDLRFLKCRPFPNFKKLKLTFFLVFRIIFLKNDCIPNSENKWQFFCYFWVDFQATFCCYMFFRILSVCDHERVKNVQLTQLCSVTFYGKIKCFKRGNFFYIPQTDFSLIFFKSDVRKSTLKNNKKNLAFVIVDKEIWPFNL